LSIPGHTAFVNLKNTDIENYENQTDFKIAGDQIHDIN